ncbi:MAG: SDR family NAD(P)-dependent oxidoreductase, partial [Pseudomonadota bacterium]
TDHERIDALAAQYQDQAIDVLINNAGVSGGYDNQVFGEINYEAFNKAIAVNTYAPIKLAETFLPMIQASEQKKIVAISSNLASITNSFGEVYIYRVSKAALNMAYRSMAKDLVDDGMIVTLLTPDPTRTDFAAAAKGASYLKKVPKRPGGITVRTAQESVTDMIRTIDSLTLQDSGTFKGYGGKAIPW